MSKLYEDLCEILVKVDKNTNIDEVIKQIKQAFIKDHWSAIPEAEVYERVLKYDDQIVCSQCQNRFTTEEDYISHTKLHDPYMTGQEWYNRFKQEFVEDRTVSYNGDMLAVARRAAGIEEEKER